MKNSIMIVSPKDETSQDFKKQDIQELYSFMTLVQGNHRNCIYIECQHGIEYMIVADRDAHPIFFPIKKFSSIYGFAALEIGERSLKVLCLSKIAIQLRIVYPSALRFNTLSPSRQSSYLFENPLVTEQRKSRCFYHKIFQMNLNLQ